MTAVNRSSAWLTAGSVKDKANANPFNQFISTLDGARWQPCNELLLDMEEEQRQARRGCIVGGERRANRGRGLRHRRCGDKPERPGCPSERGFHGWRKSVAGRVTLSLYCLLNDRDYGRNFGAVAYCVVWKTSGLSPSAGANLEKQNAQQNNV
jgi:hypothetical protein